MALPPPIQLLIYQIAREPAMNALQHAEAETILISLHESEDGVELQIRDDGKGFDTQAPPPEGHFGSVMMRERALVTGGTYSVTSQVGKGTTITAVFPSVWVEEGTALEAAEAEAGAEPSAGAQDSSSGDGQPTGTLPWKRDGEAKQPGNGQVPGTDQTSDAGRSGSTEPRPAIPA